MSVCLPVCHSAYISTSINDGPGSLVLRCPDPPCGAAVGQDMIDKLASNEDKNKYMRYLLRSYVEDSRKVDFSLKPSELLLDFDVRVTSQSFICW